MNEQDRKVAIITGGSQGIGAGLGFQSHQPVYAEDEDEKRPNYRNGNQGDIS